MIKRTRAICSIIVTAMTTMGCATYTGYTPVVDTYNNPNAYRLQQDMYECRMLAQQAGNATNEALKGGAVGAVVGAAAGAALGAATGDPGKGAAIGAASGGIGGAGYQGIDADNQYKRAYINCLRGRGQNVVN